MKQLRSINLAFLLCILFTGFSGPVHAQSAEQNTYQRLVRTGSDRLRQGDARGARDAFEESLRYIDNDPASYMGLALANYHLREDREAERALHRALELDPRLKMAYQVLGDMAHRKDDLASAAASWEKALEIDPSDSALRARLERIRKEHRTEKDFNQDSTSHFSIKYEGREKIEAGRIVLRILEDAYGEVGRALSFYPEREIAVILYSNRQFQDVTDAPGWSGGIFDGKIRIPIGGIESETPGLRRLLVHEYTHAVVRSITPRRMPTWLNEGLAQYFEGREVDPHQQEILKHLNNAGKVPPLAELEGSFLGLNGPQASSAYLLSLSAVRHMVDRYGLYRVKMVLDELSSGADPSRAITSALLISLQEFERGWKSSLE
ncbi:MAG: peptidase MA family metallohydrolase [Nitrospirota bacterium]